MRFDGEFLIYYNHYGSVSRRIKIVIIQEIHIMKANSHFSIHVTWAVKGAAVLLLLFHHLFFNSPGYVDRYEVSSVPLSWPVLNSLSYYAKICVSVFVFMTGYGMAVRMKTLDTKQRQKYTLSRFLKLESTIIFLYLFAILTTVLKPSSLLQYFKEGRLKGILLMVIDGLGLANFFDTVRLIGSWWYLSFAIFLIFLMPVMLKLYEQFGFSTVVLAAMISMFGIDETRAVGLYLFTFALGIFLEESSMIPHIRTFCTTHSGLLKCLAVFLLMFIGCSLIRIRWGFYPWMNGLCALFLVLTLFTIVDLCGLRLIPLEILGKYSFPIYLTHSLIYDHYLTRIVYSPKNWILILAWMTVLCLGLAVALEALRKLIRWDRIRLWHLADL